MRIALLCILTLSTPLALLAQEPTLAQLQDDYQAAVLPFLKQHCLDCHDAETAEAKLDLSSFSSVEAIRESHPTWKIVLDRLKAGEMPPAEAEQPTAKERERVIQWIAQLRRHDAHQNQGDPGIVLPRRLNNAEYNYVIRDLTGVDLQPTATFPLDPANEAGFDNSGESLRMSPALLRKYLDAARLVASHLVLHPQGIRFAPHPVATNTDRDKYCVKRIVQFYEQQPTDIADYLYAAWFVSQQRIAGSIDAALDAAAQRQGISPKYLRMVWKSLHRDDTEGPLAWLQSQWTSLPLDDGKAARDSARKRCRKLADQIAKMRDHIRPRFPDLFFEGNHRGSQTFVLWKNRQYATNRRSFDADRLLQESDPKAPWLDPLVLPDDDGQRQALMTSVADFCRDYPDAFYISERGRDYLGKPPAEQEKGRLLSAGFHSMMGYFRDDQPLVDMILNSSQKEELDRLWEELNFITRAPQRQYVGFLWFERTDSRYMRDPEFDFARAENKSAQSSASIKRLAKVYLGKAKRSGATAREQGAIEHYFEEIDRQIRWVEQARKAAEPLHVDALVQFADRAMRRPLTDGEDKKIRDFYRESRAAGIDHEQTMQDALAYILLAPSFCFRTDLLTKEPTDSDHPEREDPSPTDLSDLELASRLSFFLWSSLPDAELRRIAEQGQLTDPQVLLEQTRRMLQDPKARALAVEFGGNWLGFRQFQSHNSVSRERFPQFDDALRDAMFQEPVKMLLHMIQSDAPVLELIDGGYTFVNRTLAEHYGLPIAEAPNSWWKAERADSMQRGGLLPMAVFLTKNSPGLRTSPVKRGYWVVRQLLGERIPPPPPNVPELPEDESKLELSLRETLEKHREHSSCAGCHQRFDSIGLAFEGFGPIGERRQKDLANRPIDDRAEFPDGQSRTGLDGLRDYVSNARRDDFLDNLCRKLLAYGLSRTLQLSDEPLIEKMKSGDEHQFRLLIEQIVLSPQFLRK